MRLVREEMCRQGDLNLPPPPVFMALKFFEEHPSATASMFAEFIHVKKPTATVLIKGLLFKKLLERVQNEKDRRAFELRLTPKGTALLEEAQRLFELHAGGVFAALNDEEQAQLFQLLSKITNSKHA